MRAHRVSIWVWMFLLCISVATAQVKFTTVDVPGAAVTAVYGINSGGDLVGAYQQTYGAYWHAFLFRHGQFFSFDYPSAQQTVATAINDSGKIAGFYLTGNGFQAFGFVTEDRKTFRSIQYAGKLITEVRGIDNSGDMVGFAGDSQQQIGFEWRGGNFLLVGPPNHGDYGFASVTGINNGNELVGRIVQFTDNEKGFSYQAGNYTYIVYPGATSTEVDGLNDSGMMVGYYAYNNSAWYGMATKKGKFLSLTYPGATYTICQGISKKGVIVGEGYTGSTAHGFVTSPVTDADFR